MNVCVYVICIYLLISPRRNAHERPQCIAFNPEYRKRLRKLGLNAKDFRIVSPQVGEWLCGLLRNWTADNKTLKQQWVPPVNRATVFDTFTGCAGLTLATHNSMRAIAYCEQDEDCQNLLRKRMSEGNLDTAPIFSDIIALCDALENPDKNRELANMASTVIGNRDSPNCDGLQGKR